MCTCTCMCVRFCVCVLVIFLFVCLCLVVGLFVGLFVSFRLFCLLCQILGCKKKASGGVRTPVMNPNGNAFAFFGRPNTRTSSPKMVSAACVIARTPSCLPDTEGKCSAISRNCILCCRDGPDNSARCSRL